jgi:hypothetical protein
VILNASVEFLHHNFHFREGHARAAGDLHQDCLCFTEHFATVHQRIFQSDRKRFMSAIVAIGFTKTEEAAAVLISEGGEQLIETDPD